MRVHVRYLDSYLGRAAGGPYVTIMDPWNTPSVTIRLPTPSQQLARTPLELLADARRRQIEVRLSLEAMQSVVGQIMQVYRRAEDRYNIKTDGDSVARQCPIRGCVRPQRVT